MKVAIISDIHDNLANLKKCLDWCSENKIERIICCGDVANNDTLKFLDSNFKDKIFLVKGNADNFSDSDVIKYKNIEYIGKIGKIKIGDKNIGLCHEPFLIDKALELGECDIIFYGHTHKPFIEEKNGISLVNPGNLANVRFQPSFAFWDAQKGKLELKILSLI